jgi:signal peptidase I
VKPGDRVVYKNSHQYGNWGTVVILAKEHVGSTRANPPEGYIWVHWNTVHRVSLIQVKNLELMGRAEDA